MIQERHASNIRRLFLYNLESFGKRNQIRDSLEHSMISSTEKVLGKERIHIQPSDTVAVSTQGNKQTGRETNVE